MKILVVYDSAYGNTENIAQAVSSGLGNLHDVTVTRVGNVKPEQWDGLSLLVVGSPTQRFNATPALMNLLKGLARGSLKGVKVASFDTRLTKSEIATTPVLAFFVRLAGAGAYAAKHIADQLKKAGGELVAPPEGFFVEGMEGPLVDGELERAKEWAAQLVGLSNILPEALPVRPSK